MELIKKITNKNRLRTANGDTIVEVMISMVVLSFVIIVTYSLSSKTFQSSLNTQYRDQAVNLAQQQLELIKEADNSSPATISSYKPPNITAGSPFCINPNNKNVQTGNNDMFIGSPPGCKVNDLFTINVVYNDTKSTYHVTNKWDSPSGTTQQTDIFFKPSDSFSGTPVACDDANPDPNLCVSILTDRPAVGVTTDAPDPVAPNAPFHVSWSSTNIQPGTCSSSGPGFDNASVPDNGGPVTVSATIPGPNTYTVTCKDKAGTDVPGSAIVNVSAPTINYFRVNGVDAPTTVNISYKDPVTVSWSATNVTGCTASGPWSTSGAASGSAGTGRLDSNATFGLTCTKPGGGTVSAPNITVNVGPSGIFGYYYQGVGFNVLASGPYNDGTVSWCSTTWGCENGFLPNMLRPRTGLNPASCASVYWVGNILIDSPGTYNFGTSSDDGMELAVDGNLITAYWPPPYAPSPVWQQGSVFIPTAGWHKIEVWYQNNSGAGCGSDDYSAQAIAEWIPAGSSSWAVIPQDHLRPY